MKVKFIKAVDTADIVSTRLFLTNELMLDPRGNTFREMKSYAESKLDNLYEKDNGGVYDMNEIAWNEKLMSDLKNELDYNNFSRERLDFYEKVVKFVLKEKAEALNEEERKSRVTENETKTSYETESNKRSKKTIYAAVTAGSAVVALTGLCVSKMALASLGAVGMIVGGVLLYNESKK